MITFPLLTSTTEYPDASAETMDSWCSILSNSENGSVPPPPKLRRQWTGHKFVSLHRERVKTMGRALFAVAIDNPALIRHHINRVDFMLSYHPKYGLHSYTGVSPHSSHLVFRNGQFYEKRHFWAGPMADQTEFYPLPLPHRLSM